MKVSQDSNRRGAFHSQPAMKILYFIFFTKKKKLYTKASYNLGEKINATVVC